jgi:hypothetical protein
MTIEAGKYEMRGGGIATITDTGCFAYGRRDGTEDLWQLDGTHVPLRPQAGGTPPARSGHSKYDLVRRLPEALSEFWSNKLAALHIALRNGWAFSWPADPPAEWTAAALREAAGYPADAPALAGRPAGTP